MATLDSVDLKFTGDYDFNTSAALAARASFVEPLHQVGDSGVSQKVLELAFPLEGSWHPVGVRVAEHATGVRAELVANPGAVPSAHIGDQLRRIFSLEPDGHGFAALATSDPVVASLQRRFPGLRPISHRTRDFGPCPARFSRTRAACRADRCPRPSRPQSRAATGVGGEVAGHAIHQRPPARHAAGAGPQIPAGVPGNRSLLSRADPYPRSRTPGRVPADRKKPAQSDDAGLPDPRRPLRPHSAGDGRRSLDSLPQLDRSPATPHGGALARTLVALGL